MLIFTPIDPEKEPTNGRRCLLGTPLTDKEIELLKQKIRKINADESVFVFNDERYIKGETHYDFKDDKIYVTRNVFPDKSYSPHPRDNLSPRAILAHEYYGHRQGRNRYFKELEGEKIPFWQDEVYASINAAFNTPNLNSVDRAALLNEARFRAREGFHEIQLTKEMRDILYGDYDDSLKRGTVSAQEFVVFHRIPGEAGNSDTKSRRPVSRIR